jgi:serine/threonine protein kinase
MHKLCKQFVAMKIIKKKQLKDGKVESKITREIGILQKLTHPNIIKLFETFETDKHMCLVMELCSSGDLLTYVRKRKFLTEKVAKYIFKQILEGLYYCHDHSILHRDIKLENLLLNMQGVIKVFM